MNMMMFTQAFPQQEVYEPKVSKQENYSTFDVSRNSEKEGIKGEDFNKTFKKKQEKSVIEENPNRNTDENFILLKDESISMDEMHLLLKKQGSSILNAKNEKEQLQELENQLKELEILFSNILNTFFSIKIDLETKNFKQNLLKDDIMILDLLEKENFNSFLCEITNQESIESLFLREDLDDFLKLSQEVDKLSQTKQEIINELKFLLSENQQGDPIQAYLKEDKGIMEKFSLIEKFPLLEQTLQSSIEKTDNKLTSLHSIPSEIENSDTTPIHSPEKTSDFMFSSDNAFAPLKSFEISSSIKSFDTTPLFNDKLQLIQNFKEQILRKLDIKEAFQQKEISMQLEPKSLGKLSLKIIEHQGVGTAIVKVETERAKELFLANVQSLKENLENQGLKIAEFNVNVEKDSSKEEMKKAQQKSSKRIQEIMAKQLKEIQEEEMLLKEKPIDLEDVEELNINYQA